MDIDNPNMTDNIYPVYKAIQLFNQNDYSFLEDIRNIDSIKRYIYHDYEMYHIKNMVKDYIFSIHHFGKHIIDMPEYIKRITKFKDNPADIYIIDTKYNITNSIHESILLLSKELKKINLNSVLYILYSKSCDNFEDLDIKYYKIYDILDHDKNISRKTKNVLDDIFNINYTIKVDKI